MPKGDLTALLEAEGEQFEVAYNPLTGALFLRYLPQSGPRIVELLEPYGVAEEDGVRVLPSSPLHPHLSPEGDRASLTQTLAYLDRRIDASLSSPAPGGLYEIQFSVPSTVTVEEVLRQETPVKFRRALDVSGEPLDLVYAYDRSPPLTPPGDIIIYSSHSQGGYQDYYVLGDDWDNPSEPGNDDQNSVMFRDWTAAAYGSIRVPNWAHTSSNVSIAAYGKIKVYLDEVENGYSFDENTFTGADRVYFLTRGQVLTLGDQDRIVPGSIGISGQDRIFTAGAPAFMVHGAWPYAFCNDPNCPQSGFWIQGVIAAELWPQFPRISQQTAYVTPMGWEPGAVDTQYTYLIVQAFLDNTVIKINDPTTIQNPDAKVTLNKGGVYVYGHYDSSTGGLLRPAPGTQVSATGPVQAGLFTSGGQSIDTRYYVLTPREILGSRYVVPVGSSVEHQGGRTELSRLYIYSFANQNIHIRDKLGTQTIALTGGVAYDSYALPIGSGAEVWNDYGNDPNFDFWILGAFDSGGPRDDWGYQPVDSSLLNKEYFMPYSPSDYDPSNNAACPETEPMWVSPVEDTTTVNFDFDGDGAADRTEFLNTLDVVKVTDLTDHDNTGTRVWSDKQFALAYGIDGACSSPSSGNLDFGYSALPFLGNWSSEFLKVTKSGNVSSMQQKSGLVKYTINVVAPRVDVFSVNVTDTLPQGWQYVPLSTTINFSFGGVNRSGAAAEPIVVGQQLLWNGIGNVLKGAAMTLTFVARVSGGASYGANENVAQAEGVDLAGNVFTSEGKFTTTIQPPPLRNKELYLRETSLPVKAVDGTMTTSILNRTSPPAPADRAHPLFSPISFHLYPELAAELGIYGTVNLTAKMQGGATTSTVQFDLFDLSPSGARTQVARAAKTVAAGITQTYQFGVTNAFYTVPAGHALLLQVSSVSGTAPTLLYDSTASPAHLDILTFTYVDLENAATYKGASPSQYFYRGDTVTVRANVTDPFGSYDISGSRLTVINSLGGTVVADAPMNLDSTDPLWPSLWKRFSSSYDIRTSDPLGWWTARVTAVEGNGVTDVVDVPFYVSFYGVSVEPDRTIVASPGADAQFDETVRNEGVVFDTFDVSVSPSTMGWPSRVYFGARLVARDDDGDGGFDYVDFLSDSNANGLPDIALGVGASATVTVLKPVPLSANQLDVDEMRLYARSIGDPLVVDSALLTTRVPGPAERIKELYLHGTSAGDRTLDRTVPTGAGYTDQIREGEIRTWRLVPLLAGPFSVRLAKLVAQLDVEGGASHVVRVRLLDGGAPVATRDTIVPDIRGWYDLPVDPSSTYIFATGAQIRIEVSFPDDGDPTQERVHLWYDSSAYPSRLEATTTTYVDVDWVNTYDASGTQTSLFQAGDTVLIRALVTDPFGDYDISSARVTVTDPTGAILVNDQPMAVYSSSPRIYQRPLALSGTAQVGTYTISVTAVEGNGVTDTGGGSFEVPSGPVWIGKSGDRTVVEPGGVLNYRVDYSIAGTLNSPVVWVNDTLPVGVTFISSVPPPTSISGNILRWRFTDLPPGNYSITIRVQVGSLPDGTKLTNIVEITVLDAAGNLQGPFAAAFTVTVRSTTVPAAKVVDKPAAYLQETLTYTVYYNNTGGAPAPMAWVNDTLPPGTVFLGATLPYKSQIGQTYFWELVNVAPGDHSFVIAVLLAGGAPGELKRNLLTIHHSTPSGEIKRTADDATTIVLGADVGLKKVSSASRASPGQTLVFTLYYNNTGNAPAEVWLNDTLPSGLLFVSSSPPPSAQLPPLYSWHFLSVPPGAHSVNVTVQVTWNASGPHVNRASLHAFDKRGTWYPWKFSNVTVEIVPPGILPVKTGPATATPYDTITYTLHYNNTSNETVRRLRLNDTLPPNVTFISSSVPPSSVSGANISWSLNDIAPGAHSIDVVVRLPLAADSTLLTNRLRANYTLSGLGFDLVAEHNLTIRAPVIVAAKISDKKVASHNQVVMFTLYYNNTGKDTASQVIVEDTLPVDMAFVNSTPPPSSVIGNAVRWVLNGVAPGPHAISLSARVLTTAPFNTYLINSLKEEVFDSTGDYLYNTSASARVRVQMPVIDAAKTGVIGGAFLDLVTYTLYFNNTGIREASVAWVNDTLPPEEEFVSAVPPPASVSGSTIGWVFTDVAVGAHSLTLTVRVKADTLNNTVLVNRVRVEYLDPFGIPQLPSDAEHRLVYPYGIDPYVFPAGTIVIPMDGQQAGPGADPAASYFPGQVSAYGLVHWLLADAVPVYQAMRQAKAYGSADFTIPTDDDGDPNAQGSVGTRPYGGGAFLIPDPVLATPENEGWARIAAVRAAQSLYGDVAIHELMVPLSMMPDDVMLVLTPPRIAARSDSSHSGWTQTNLDQIDFVWDRARYPTAGIPIDPFLAAELRLGALAGGDCERAAHDILILGDDEFGDPANFPDKDIFFELVGDYVNRSGLVILECTGATLATRMPFMLGPDANATLIEENDLTRGAPYSLSSALTGHPLAQSWGFPGLSRGTFMGWDAGNAFANDTLFIASAFEPSPGDGQGEYWGWPAGGAPGIRGETPDIVPAAGEYDPVLLLDPAGRGGVASVAGHAQGRDTPYGPMTSTTGPRQVLQSTLLSSAWPRLRHAIDPPIAAPGDYVTVTVNLTFESGFALRGVDINEKLEPGVFLVPGSLKAGWRGAASHDPLTNEIDVSYSYVDPRRSPVFATFQLQFTVGGDDQVLMTTFAKFADKWSLHEVNGSRCARVNPTLAPGGMGLGEADAVVRPVARDDLGDAGPIAAVMNSPVRSNSREEEDGAG